MSPTRLPVRWRDLDPLGHVNAAVFLTYLEEGRNVWLREVLGDGFGPEQYVLARVEIDFRAEIAAGAEYVQTDHELASVGRSSISVVERLSDSGGVTAAQARVVLVMWDPHRRGSRPVSEAEREALAGLAVSS